MKILSWGICGFDEYYKSQVTIGLRKFIIIVLPTYGNVSDLFILKYLTPVCRQAGTETLTKKTLISFSFPLCAIASLRPCASVPYWNQQVYNTTPFSFKISIEPSGT